MGLRRQEVSTSPVPKLEQTFAFKMLSQQPHIATIGPPPDIEEIARNGNSTRHSFYNDVPNHLNHEQPRHPKPMGFIDYPTGQSRSCDIADPRHQTKNRLNAKSDICTGNQKCNVKKL